MTHPLSISGDKEPPIRAVIALASLALLLLSLAAAASSAADPPTEGAYVFRSSGVHGGGFQNVIAVGPGGDSVIVGGDVSGFSRSVDSGRTWSSSNAGVWSISMRAVASIVVSPTDPLTIYAGTGYQGRRGGFLVSEDGGRTWAARSLVPQFSGSSNSVAGLPSAHPRSTGTLIAVDSARSVLYAATFEQGVMRSSDGGRTWATIGLAGRYLRSIVMDPLGTDAVLIATYGQGVWKATGASDQAVFERLTGAPGVVEELAVVGTDLYAAAGPNGIYHVTDGGQSWARLGAGSLPTTGPKWTTIAGVVGCQGTTLYAGAHGSAAWSLARSRDGGATWTPVTSTQISTFIGGPDGDRWWLAAKKPRLMLGGSGYTAGQVAILPPTTPCGSERILLAGRSGVWGSSDGGSSWYPHVKGLSTTISHSVGVDPSDSTRVALGVSDWGHLFSKDGANSVMMALPSGVTDAFDVDFDTSSTVPTVLLATGHPGTNTKGEVFSSVDPVAGVWKDEGLSGSVGSKRVLAVTSGRNSAGARVIVAAVDGGGVWRKIGTGSWRRGSGSAMSALQKTKRASLSWPAGSSTIFLYDRESGVWRSNDIGASWVRIWAQPSPLDMTGFVAAADGDPSTLFVSVGGRGVFRIDGATSGAVGAGLTATPLGAITDPGPIALHGGRVFATRLASGGLPAQILVSDDRGATWTAVGDAFYESSALSPRDIAIAADGTIYVALNGAGMIRGQLPPG